MKKLSGERRLREIRLCRRRNTRRLKRLKLQTTRHAQVASGELPSKKKNGVILFAPAVFDIFEKELRRPVLRFLSRLRHLVVIEQKKVRINFSNTRSMISPGTLLLTAELNRLCRYLGDARQITCSYPKNNKVEQVLQQIGIFKLLRKEERLAPSADDVVSWRFIDGSLAEGEKANALIEAFAEKLPPAFSRALYNGLVEAMTNCVHHAYLEARGDEIKAGLESGWWMFAQERNGVLSIVICDLGIGIPKSLPKTHDPNIVEQALEKIARVVKAKGYRDVDYIGAALTLGKTRTQQPGRGYGLTQFREVVEKIQDGKLRIFSNRGCYTFFKQNGETIERRDEFRDSIQGTLVQWSVPLEKLT